MTVGSPERLIVIVPFPSPLAEPDCSVGDGWLEEPEACAETMKPPERLTALMKRPLSYSRPTST